MSIIYDNYEFMEVLLWMVAAETGNQGRDDEVEATLL